MALGSALSMKRLRRSMRKALSLAPEAVRFPLVRRSLNLQYELPSELTIETARSFEDLEQAFRILHDAYVEFGYMKPHPSGLRVLPQHALLSTTVLVVKMGQEVIGTASLIQDNPLGLPMESIFNLSSLRQGGARLAEVSSLAFKKGYRAEHGKFLFPLVKFIFNYLLYVAPVDYSVIAIHPTMADLYRIFFMFSKLDCASVESYDFVNGVPAVGEYVPMREARERYHGAFSAAPESRDVNHYIFGVEFSQLKYPERTYFRAFDSILTPVYLREFFIERTQSLCSLPMKKRVALSRHYSGSPFEADIFRLCDGVRPLDFRSEYRFVTKCAALMADRSRGEAFFDILQASRSGLQLRAPAAYSCGDRKMELRIEVGPACHANVIAEPIWNQGPIAGYRILDASSQWQEYLNYLESCLGAREKQERKLAS